MQFDLQSLLFSIIFIFSPLLLTTLVYLIIRLIKKDSLVEKVYLRFLLGYAVFNVFYILIPATINVINPPKTNIYLVLC